MAFFKRKLTVIESFESALKSKQAARQKLAEQLNIAEKVLEEKCLVAERVAIAGAANASLNEEKSTCGPSRTAPNHCVPHWQNSMSRYSEARAAIHPPPLRLVGAIADHAACAEGPQKLNCVRWRGRCLCPHHEGPFGPRAATPSRRVIVY
jgi:hypothetical protein